MITLTLGQVTESVRRLLDPTLVVLGHFADSASATVLVGAPTARQPGLGGQGPLVVVPAFGPGRPEPWTMDVLRHADAIVTLDESELVWLANVRCPVLQASIPRPIGQREGLGVCASAARPATIQVWHSLHAGLPLDSPGIAWVAGAGAAAAAETVVAWSEHRVVIALRPPARGLLAGPPVLSAATSLEVVETTAMLNGAPALADALARDGARVLAGLPSPMETALTLMEAVVAAEARPRENHGEGEHRHRD